MDSGKVDVEAAAAPTTFELALHRAEELNAAVEVASERLQGFPRGPMGLTPDAVKRSPEFQEAKSHFDAAFQRARAFNGWYTKAFKKELAAHRARLRSQRLGNTESPGA